jgi:hypothetical protein
MTSTRPAPATHGGLQRFANWILDHDGTMYGDERERLRWYEAIAILGSIQGILVPWALAICVWLGGRTAAPYLLAVFLVFCLPQFVAAGYIRRRRVRIRPERVDRKYVVVAVATNLPYFIVVAGLVRAYVPDGSVTGAVVGGLVGGCAGVAAVRLAQWLRRRRPVPAAVEELD